VLEQLSEGAWVSDCSSRCGAGVGSGSMSLDDAPGICVEVEEMRTSASSAAAIRRLRSMGVSMDVLTVHSCRAVRLRMRESCSTSAASAVSHRTSWEGLELILEAH
jgi:hypothetical protein